VDYIFQFYSRLALNDDYHNKIAQLLHFQFYSRLAEKLIYRVAY